MNSPTGQTCRRTFTLDGSNDADLRKDVPFGGFVDIAFHFGGVNRRFQAKRAKYWKFHVIETNASFSTKFCTTIETNKNSSWVVPIGAQQFQDGGRPPFWKKPLNCYISATVWPILIRFDASRWHSGNVMVGNITVLMIFAVFDPSPLTV